MLQGLLAYELSADGIDTYIFYKQKREIKYYYSETFGRQYRI